MKDTYTSENGRDFRQRYVGCFGRYTTSRGEKLTVYIEDLTPTEVRFQNKEGISLSARVDSGVEFEFYPLNRRLTDYNGTVVYSERKPQRQWQRGVCSGNTRIMDLVRMREVAVDHVVVDAIYNSEPNYLNTYSDFEAKRRTNFLLSDKFAVINGSLYVYDKKIGTMVGNTITVSEMFAQEVKDALNRSDFRTLKVTTYANN